MRKLLIKIGLIASAAALLFVWMRGDVSALSGAHPLGLDDSSGWIAANSHNPEVLDTLEAANAGALRVEIPWDKVERSPGAFAWTFDTEFGTVDLNQLFTRLQRRGIEPIAVLSGGPVYASHLFPQQPVQPEQFLENMARFAAAAAAQFGDHVRYWQIGEAVNDPQAWGEMVFPGDDNALAEPDPVLYSRLVQAASHAIKSESSGAIILLGDLDFSADCAYHPASFLQVIDEQDAWYAFDVVQLALPEMHERPETALVYTCGIMPAQPSGIPAADSTHAVAEFITEKGEKPLWVHGLQFNAEFIAQEAELRATIQEAVSSDLLARASALMRGYGSADRVFWQFAPLQNTPGLLALQTYANLSKTLGGRFDGDGLPQSADAFALRFRGGGKLNMVTWFALGGEEVRPVMIGSAEGYDLSAFSADSNSLQPKSGIPLPVDAGDNIALLASERPVLISGHPADIKQTITQTVEDGAAQAKAGVKASLNNWLQAQKVKAADKLNGWVAEQKASLIETVKISLMDWLRNTLGLA